MNIFKRFVLKVGLDGITKEGLMGKGRGGKGEEIH